MKLRKTLAAAATTMACTAGITVAATGPAHAAAWEPCPDGYVCAYMGYEGTGTIIYGTTENPSVGPVYNDRISSLWNRTDRAVCFYTDANFRGTSLALGPDGWQGDLWLYNDVISSWSAAWC